MNKQGPHYFLHYIFFAIIVVVWTYAMYTFPPEFIVEKVGIQNGYAIAFFAAFLGSLSFFISIPYYLLLATFAAGGLDPYVLGLISGSGVTLADTITYFLGYKGRDVLPEFFSHAFERVYNSVVFPWVIPLILFFYAAFVPLSNDFITISLGIIRYPYRKMIIPLGIGNVFFGIAVSLLGAYGL